MFNFFCINIFIAVVAYAASQNLESLMEVCLQERGTSPILLISNAKFPLFYEHLNYQWNERLGQTLPLAILTAQSSLDVSNGIICGRELGIHIVPKSGGHSFEKYSHGDNSTIVIELVNLRQITIERNALTADVGAGVLLAHLYAKAWNDAELGFVAGTCVSVGATLSLGAGYGHVAHIYGVTSDNVLEVEIVTADGEIRVVSENSNPDLFWALRGAGAGNFGIATRIKHQLFDASATAIKHTMTTTSLGTAQANCTLSTTVKKEMNLFQGGGTKGYNLQLVFDYLKTIPPSSVSSERAFSSAGYLCNKVRCSLNDDTLDSLCRLRSHFQLKLN